MKVAVHVAYGNVAMKCPACTGPDAGPLRGMENCDLIQMLGEPTSDRSGRLLSQYDGKVQRLSITCTVCAGRDASCEVCRGGGEERVFQCPGTICDADTSAVIRAYGDYKNGVLPDSCGMYDQAAPFVDMIRVVDGELAALQAEEVRNRKSKGYKAR